MTNEEAKELLIHVLMTYEPRDQYGDWDDSEPYEEAITMAIKALQANTDGDTISRQDTIDAFSDVLDSDFPGVSEETPRERIESIPSAEQKKGTLTKEVREALMRLTMCAREECKVCKYEDDCGFDAQYQRATENMIIIANALKEPKTGEWVWKKDAMDWGIGAWVCNKCGCRPNTLWSTKRDSIPLAYAGSLFCGYCGAYMGGQNDGQKR